MTWFTRFRKANPYHDATGAFTTKDKAVWPAKGTPTKDKKTGVVFSHDGEGGAQLYYPDDPDSSFASIKAVGGGYEVTSFAGSNAKVVGKVFESRVQAARALYRMVDDESYQYALDTESGANDWKNH